MCYIITHICTHYYKTYAGECDMRRWYTFFPEKKKWWLCSDKIHVDFTISFWYVYYFWPNFMFVLYSLIVWKKNRLSNFWKRFTWIILFIYIVKIAISVIHTWYWIDDMICLYHLSVTFISVVMYACVLIVEIMSHLRNSHSVVDLRVVSTYIPIAFIKVLVQILKVFHNTNRYVEILLD